MVKVKHEKPRGILHSRGREGVSRYWASEDLHPFIEHFWIVRWNVPAPVTAETLPHPSVHMAIYKDSAEIVGVMRARRFTTVLEGTGRVIGTKFRPGAFRAFIDRPVSSLSDHRWPLRDVFGARAEGFAGEAFSRDDDEESIGIIETFLRSLHPQRDESMDLAERIVARIAEDRSHTRVEQIVNEFSMSARQLQRLFSEYVGGSPKWVIQRYRLIEAAERLANGAEDLATLALELGYADQAHFIRDFKRIVGRAPARYARALQ